MTAEEIAITRARLNRKEPEQPTRMKPTRLFLPPDQIERLDAIARRHRKSRSSLMRDAVVSTYLNTARVE